MRAYWVRVRVTGLTDWITSQRNVTLIPLPVFSSSSSPDKTDSMQHVWMHIVARKH